jgi:hypothetical protein
VVDQEQGLIQGSDLEVFIGPNINIRTSFHVGLLEKKGITSQKGIELYTSQSVSKFPNVSLKGTSLRFAVKSCQNS